jgi:hypothetical protein
MVRSDCSCEGGRRQYESIRVEGMARRSRLEQNDVQEPRDGDSHGAVNKIVNALFRRSWWRDTLIALLLACVFAPAVALGHGLGIGPAGEILWACLSGHCEDPFTQLAIAGLSILTVGGFVLAILRRFGLLILSLGIAALVLGAFVIVAT